LFFNDGQAGGGLNEFEFQIGIDLAGNVPIVYCSDNSHSLKPNI
jgi:hypothetical protein